MQAKEYTKHACSLCTDLKEKPYREIMRNAHCVLMTGYEPLVEGHCMVLPLRHVKTWAALKPVEAKEAWELIDDACALLSKEYALDCVIHANKGMHASQAHVHAHILPIQERLQIRGLVSKELNTPPRMRASKEALKALHARLAARQRQPKA